MQAGGEHEGKGGTATKSAILVEVAADVRAIVRTAALIAKEENNPQIAETFARPKNKSGTEIIAVATDFLAKLQNDELWAKFAAGGRDAL